MTMSDDDLLCKYIKSRANNSEVVKLDNHQRAETNSDIVLFFEDKKKTKSSMLLFKNVCVSKNILDTKWKTGSKNYAVNIASILDCNNEMKWFAFKDYYSKEDSWNFIHESVIKSWINDFERLNLQKVVLIPLQFVNECSMRFESLFDHYKKEIEIYKA